MGKLQPLLLSFVLLLFTNLALAQELKLPENHAVNGGLTIIPVNMKQKPEVSFNDKDIIVLPSFKANQWLLLVGIPLSTQSPIQELKVKKPVKGTIPFHISEKHYPTQRLTISNQRKVDPYAQDRARIEQEKKEQAKLFAQYTERNPFKEGFIAPSRGPISSLFGLKRVYNNQERDPHSGLDIASPQGDPIIATNGGTVVSAKDYFFTGNTVIIDHGMGLFSLYAHLDSFDVKTGDTVQQGQLLGKVGSTGRVTGPHLHWSMIVNQTLVDPLLFVHAAAIRKS
ncbi:MAG: peptidoglycan DD-metalloendopeptidase family protein [Legionellaceae bacterium]|nr:peptidoglycan DD-metalloendopeptidase family protein [Legionellaceae bacterium]